MDTFFKILFGFLLGIVVFLGHDFFSASEARQRGLVVAWVPKNSPFANPNYAGNDTAANPVKVARNGASGVPASAENDTAPAPESDVTLPADPVVLPEEKLLDIPTLSLYPRRWPALVTLTQEFVLPLMDGDRLLGELPLKPGTQVGLLRVQGDGRLFVRYQNQSFFIKGEYTNILEVALPEPPKPVFPVAAPQESSPPPTANYLPAANNNGATLFGVPIAPDTVPPKKTAR